MSNTSTDTTTEKKNGTPDEIITFDELYRTYTLKALNRSCCIRHAARLLGVNERTVYHWKKAYGIVWSKEAGRYIISNNPLKA